MLWCLVELKRQACISIEQHLSAPPQISYSGVRSFDPSVPLQRPGLTVSLPSNATHHLFSQLHPGVTYQLSIRASTSKGFGPATTLNVTTNISGRKYVFSSFTTNIFYIFLSLLISACTKSISTDSHLDRQQRDTCTLTQTLSLSSAPTIDEYDGSEAFLNETATTITVLLKPAQAKGAPIRYCMHTYMPYLHIHCSTYSPACIW